jgi:DnaJ-class molecular chaperone
MTQKDYYRVLGIDKTVSPQKIKEAYRKLAFKYHPDRQSDNIDSAEKMKSINEAYAVLSNEKKRREYDAMRHQFGASATGEFRKAYSEQDIFKGSDIHKIFEEMAKSFGLRGFEDIFKEHYGKGYQSFRIEKPGFFMGGFFFSGKLGSPIGFQHLLSGKGLGKFPRLIFEQLTGTKLPQKGVDRVEAITLSLTQAAEGGPYAYYHRKQSKKLIVKIPPGIRHGQQIRLQGMGEAGNAGGVAGNLYLKVNIKKPLSHKIKAFIEDFRKKS